MKKTYSIVIEMRMMWSSQEVREAEEQLCKSNETRFFKN